MISYTNDFSFFQEKLSSLKNITNLSSLPQQLLIDSQFKSVFMPDVFYQNPWLINSICQFSKQTGGLKIILISIDAAADNEDSIRKIYRDPRWHSLLETDYYPILSIDNSCSYESIINEINKSTNGDVVANIINGEVYSSVWVFDASKDWLICNQRPDITLFSTSNKKLMDHILSLKDEMALWIPMGHEIDRENLPPYITKAEFDEGIISDAAKSFTLDLLNNYQWKDWE